MKSRGLRKIPTCSYGAIWSVGFCSAPALRQSNTFTPIKSRNLSNQRGTTQYVKVYFYKQWEEINIAHMVNFSSYLEVRNIFCHIPRVPMLPKRNIGKSLHKQCMIMLGVERKCRKSLLKARAEIETSLLMGHPRDGSGKKYREKLPGNDDLFFAIENPASFHPKNNPVPSARTCM